MAVGFADRVREQVSGFAGGTGALTLPVTAASGCQTFLAGWGASGTGPYCIVIGSQWEVGYGTINAGGTSLTRTTPKNGSSGAGVAVNFSAGTADCFGDAGAYLLQFLAHAILVAQGFSSLIMPPQGRLTLQTAVPVMVTTQSAKTTLYYTPYVGRMVPLYDGVRFAPIDIGAELSVLTTDTTKSPAAIGASKVNDWFVWYDAGTYRLSHGPDWTNDTTRSAGTALVMTNGILLNNASITNGPAASRGTYVGTTRSNASSQLDWILGAAAAGGTAASLYVWNAYNRVLVETMVNDSTDSWTYGTNTWRPADNSTTMRISFVMGLQEDNCSFAYIGLATTGASTGAICGVAFDSTTTPSGIFTEATGAATNSFNSRATGTFLGAHYAQAMENSVGGTITFYGDNGATNLQSGYTGTLRM